jgi:orotidine-5'-phosphate decarboxylase
MERDRLLASLRGMAGAQRVITALDVPDAEAAVSLAAGLGPEGRLVKVGLELFSAAGPEVVRRLQALGKGIFLDLKYHDIPNTVAAAARVAARLGVAMCTVHAACGRRALAAAAEALRTAPAGPGGPRPALLAVTVLTSLGQEELDEVAPAPEGLEARIVRLARVAWQSGCDGIVCSARDLGRLRSDLGPEPLVVTPGLRPAAAATDDQRRTAPPADAVAAGADYLVIGRPITRAGDPAAALAAIGRELAANGPIPPPVRGPKETRRP